MPKKQIPIDAIVDLRRRLEQLPPRSSSRRVLVQEIAQLYGISEDTVYRTLREGNRLVLNIIWVRKNGRTEI
jgi:hypothetical protein